MFMVSPKELGLGALNVIDGERLIGGSMVGSKEPWQDFTQDNGDCSPTPCPPPEGYIWDSELGRYVFVG